MSPRAKLLALIALFVAPTLASFAIFYFAPPSGSGNYGTLIVPLVTLPKPVPPRLDATPPAAPAPIEGKWWLLTRDDGSCAQACRDKLHLMRQAHTLLGRDQDRVARIVLADAPPTDEVRRDYAGTVWLDAKRSSWAAQLPAGEHGAYERLYLVDPLGNAFIFYGANPDPALFLKDLKRVLKASQIG